MQYKQAKEIADNIVLMLSPFCDRIEIAGSIRRKKELIGDVEIVAIPNDRFQLGLIVTLVIFIFYFVLDIIKIKKGDNEQWY